MAGMNTQLQIARWALLLVWIAAGVAMGLGGWGWTWLLSIVSLFSLVGFFKLGMRLKRIPANSRDLPSNPAG